MTESVRTTDVTRRAILGRFAAVGIIAQADVDSDKVNVIAGNALWRRAVYTSVVPLPIDALDGMNDVLGQMSSTGESTLIIPSDIIGATVNALISLVHREAGGSNSATNARTCSAMSSRMRRTTSMGWPAGSSSVQLR